MRTLRENCSLEIFDYGWLMSQLKDFESPRDKVTRLLRHQDIIRIKKGIYVFPPKERKEPLSLYHLANLLFGPSYVSKEAALAKYEMIPERVENITSMTTQRNKQFDTPCGRFSYQHLNMKAYGVGIRWEIISDHARCWIASPEKALCDTIAHCNELKTKEALLDYLINGLRVEEGLLFQLDKVLLKEIAESYQKPVITLLSGSL